MASSSTSWALSLVAFIAILITGQYPRILFDLVVANSRWALRVAAYAGPLLGHFMVDKYPAFSLEQTPDDHAFLHVEYPERLSRLHAILKLLLGWLYVGIPHGIILTLYGIILLIMHFFAWFIILFTGRYPTPVFTLAEGYLRWSVRVNLYLSFVRDEYPKFSLSP